KVRHGADVLAAVGWSRFVGKGKVERGLGESGVANAAEKPVKRVAHEWFLFLARLAKKPFPRGDVSLPGNDLKNGGAKRTADRGGIAGDIAAVGFRHHFGIAEFSEGAD